MADDNVNITIESLNEAQRSVVKAQEVVDRYVAKINEIEERSDFKGGGEAAYFLDRLKEANECLREREESLRIREASLKEREEHLRLLKQNKEGSHVAAGVRPGSSIAVPQQYENGKKFLIDRIESLSTSMVSQADSMKDQLDVMKTEIENFVFAATTSAFAPDSSAINVPPLHTANEPGGSSSILERIETGQGYQMHFFDGALHRVPADWDFPSCSARQLWKQWWIGNSNRQIPPLRFLTANDIKHLDIRPVNESQGVKTGNAKHHRRKVSKLLSDMRFVMKYITKLVEEEGAMTDTITPSAVWRMFDAIKHRLSAAAINDSNKWLTLVRTLRSSHVTTTPDTPGTVVQNSTI